MEKVTIAISGAPGAGTSSIAKELAKKLNLEYFSPGAIQKSYAKIGKESLAALEVWKTRRGKSEEFHREVLDKTQIEKAKKGNIVICGKLSIKMLKDLADYKIWVDTPLDVRAKRVANRDKITEGKALKLLSEREDIERKEWKRIYGFDYFSQENIADFVLDNSNLSLGQAVGKISEFIKGRN